MSVALLRISKLIPMLSSSNDHERLAALALIERALLTDGLSFTDAGLSLREFVLTVMGTEDPVALAATAPAPATARPSFTRTTPQPAYTTAPSRPNPPKRQKPQWSQPITWSSTIRTLAEYEARLNRILGHKSFNHKIKSASERKFLEDMYFRLCNGEEVWRLSHRQKTWLDEVLDRYPLTI